MTKHLYSNISRKNTAKVFLDTNVALDLAIKRQPFYKESEFVIELQQACLLELLISSGSIVTMIYLASERYKMPDAETKLIKFIEGCDVKCTDKEITLNSLASTFRDKEDAYQYFTAVRNEADYFLTRNTKDFRSRVPYILPVLTPLQFEYMLL